MQPGDPRFATFPLAPGAAQLRWYIRQTADGVLNIEDLLADFRALHEAIEKNGPPQFASDDEARAVWDVLWAVEFCSGNNPPATGGALDGMLAAGGARNHGPGRETDHQGPSSDAEWGRGGPPAGGETQELLSPDEVLVIVRRAATHLAP